MRQLIRIFTLVVIASHADAQSLAQRVAAAGDGTVSFHYAARPGICGDGEHFVRLGASSYIGSLNGRSEEWGRLCAPGPVQVRLTMTDGRVTRADYWVGPLRPRGDHDLGAVRASDAAHYLLDLAGRAGGRTSDRTLLPAVLADSTVVWPSLLAIARESQARGVRTEAAFWLSRFAAAKLAGHPEDLAAGDEDASDEESAGEDVKAHAVFVLSQLPHGEGVEPLLQVARTNKDVHVRSRALFWLGQSGDARALELFESILKN